MSASPNPLTSFVDQLVDARNSLRAIAQFSNTYPNFSVEEAYDVQARLLERDLATGKRIAGYKMGLTSKAKQRDVNVFESIHGYLTSDMEIFPGQTLTASTRIHPRVEPEIAVVFGRSVAGASRISDLTSKIEYIGPALEILDSRYENFTFQLPDVIADNTSASGFLLGTTNYLHRMEDIPLLGTVLRLNGDVVGTGAPAAVLGNPLISVLELVKRLAANNREIAAGQVVLTGGITASISVKATDWVELLMPKAVLTLHVV